MTTQGGITIRMSVKSIRSQGRNTLGVRIIRLDEGDQVRDAVVLAAALEGAPPVEGELPSPPPGPIGPGDEPDDGGDDETTTEEPPSPPDGGPDDDGPAPETR